MLQGIAEFAAVIEAGGFTAAAQRLGMSKSSVSEQVARLEARLGQRLLHRTTRSVSPTEAGAAFYPRCRRILAEAGEAESELQMLRGEPRGQLRIATTAAFASRHLVPALAEFRARHPLVGFDILAADRVAALTEQRIDLAIRVVALHASTLVLRRLAPLRVLLCAAPAYLASHGCPETPAELSRHRCLAFEPAGWGSQWRFRATSGAATRVRVDGLLRSDEGIVLRDLALAGAGIGLFPTFMVDDEIRQGRLVPLLADWWLEDMAGRALAAVFPGNRRTPPKVRAFVDFLARRIGDPPRWDRGLPAAD